METQGGTQHEQALNPPPNKRLERTGEQPGYFMRVSVVAGRSTAGR